MRRLTVVFVLMGLLAASCSSGADKATRAASSASHWVATWAASPQPAEPPTVTAHPESFENQTIRQIAHVSIGGHELRVRFSNEYGTTPLEIGGAHVGVQSTGAGIVADTDRVLTFGGRSNATIPAHAPLFSDPVILDVARASNIAVSVYLPKATTAQTLHALARQTNYISTPGNSTGATVLPVASTTTSWFFLSGIAMKEPQDSAAIVALGDSITDGYASTTGANHRWPNLLAARLQARHDRLSDLAVVNQGIDGNRTTFDVVGPGALARFDRDVLATPGVRYVILLEGINDIGLPGFLGSPAQSVSAAQIIATYQQLIDRAHEQGLKIFGGTLTPFDGALIPGYYSAAGDAKRAAVNRWIRTSGRFDAVIDFDAAIRDPSHPARLLPAYDSGDHLHPNDAGYAVMANTIDERLFSGHE